MLLCIANNKCPIIKTVSQYVVNVGAVCSSYADTVMYSCALKISILRYFNMQV